MSEREAHLSRYLRKALRGEPLELGTHDERPATAALSPGLTVRGV